MDLDPTRLRVMKLIQQRRTDLKKASLAIGRNAAYLQQYLYRGIPKTLPEDAREALAAFLGVPEESLRPAKTESAMEPALPQAVAAAPATAIGGGMPGFSQVPELDVRASAGHGAFHEGDEGHQMADHAARFTAHQLRYVGVFFSAASSTNRCRTRHRCRQNRKPGNSTIRVLRTSARSAP